MSRLLFAVFLLLHGGGVFSGRSEADASEAEISRVDAGDVALLPPTTVLYAELTDPKALVSLIFDHPLRQKIEALPPYQTAIQSAGYKSFLFGRAMVETQLQMSWREAVEALFANRVTVAFDVTTNSPVAIIHGKDAASMKLFGEKVLEFAKLGANADQIRESEYRGVPVFKIQNALYGISDDRMIITNQPDLGRAVIDRMLDQGASLLDNPRFDSAWQTRPADALAWAFADVEVLRASAGKPFEDQINNPVLELLVGGIQSALANSPYATATFRGNAEAVSLALATPFKADWVPEYREYYFGVDATGRGPAIPEADGTLFAMSTYRDFSEMWLRAGDLFNADINDGFAQADANLSTLFAGRDFGEDILGSFESEVAVVATRQDFSQQLPRPTLELPALGAVFKLKQPEKMTRELRRIFQSLIGFLNVVGAMNGQNQLELDMEKLEQKAELVTSSFVPETDQEESTEAELIFNFSPSIGFAGDRFVVASSASLARELVQAKLEGLTATADNTNGILHADVLQQVLSDNREQLVSQNMLEDGNSREEAEAVIDLLVQVVGYFESMSIRLTPSGDLLETELQVRVAP
ncbi:MAG: hypothetical protein P8L85_12215 [Rubripirellula sp.]|nr:hypothetical protein [Rubripirellula sp.]